MKTKRVGAPGALIAWLGDEISTRTAAPSSREKHFFKEASKTRNEWYNQVVVLDYFALMFFATTLITR